jgi:hypothetical protein
MSQTGTNGLSDASPPRVISVQPVSLGAVEVIFNESVDPSTAGNPANYLLRMSGRDYVPTAATVNTQWGNRVRLTVALEYPGCAVTYVLLPGPIEDVAGQVGGGPNNVLDTADPANHATFTLNGSISVTFGDTGVETFGNIAKDASFIPGLTTWSHAHMLCYPQTNPPLKGFVAFDFIPTLTGVCGVSNSAQILDGRFSAVTMLAHRPVLLLRRCLMPWGEPPNDWCADCPGAVTVNSATHPSIPWHQTGARAVGGSGTNPSEYHPTGSFDVASTIDANATVTGVNERITFWNNLVTNAFRFWFDNPTKNFGYSVEVAGGTGGTEFHNTTAEDGRDGIIVSITFAIAPNGTDCNANGQSDVCEGAYNDVDLFIAELLATTQDPTLACLFDRNMDGSVNGKDISLFVSGLLQG